MNNMKMKHFRRRAGNLLGVMLWLAVLPLAAFGQANYAAPYTFTTLAGNNGNGSADGTNSAARFANPLGVAVGTNGNVYVADTANNTIREVMPVGTNWVVTTLAGLAGNPGSADGMGSAARFNNPSGIAVDSAGNLYVAEYGNDTIREVTPVGTNWVVTTLAGLAGSPGSADGTNGAARFNQPYSLEVDSVGNVYVADTYNDTIRKVTPVGTNWVVTTLAGLAGNAGFVNGTGTNALFNTPFGVAVDSAGNLYVGDTFNNTIRKVTPAGVVTTLATAGFNDPVGVAVDSATNVYVGDWGSFTIRKVTPGGVVTTLAGLAGSSGTNDGTASAARFNHPYGVAVDTNGNVYVADNGNNMIRRVTPAGVVTTLATGINYPQGVAVDTNGNVYVADNGNNTIRKVTLAGVVTTLATGFSSPIGVAVDTNGNVYVADNGNNTIWKVTPAGVVTTLATGFSSPTGVAVDTNGNVYVADNGNNTIRKVTPAGVVTTIAGLAGSAGSADGTNSAARFNAPYLVAVDGATNVYVADTDNYTIRKVTPVGTNWVVTTLAGLAGSFGSADGTGTNAQFWFPESVAVDSAGNLYVGDNNNSEIRKGFPASSVPAPKLQPPSLSAGQFGFRITGLPNLAVDIESSGDLSQWQLAGTVILEGGTNFFVSPNPAQGAQFYRVHVR
ncbi:MAG: hypothetical protein ACLQU3_00505 [Limisphaerales bacterium]